MPRMPRPGELPGGGGQSGSWIPRPSYSSTSNNIKLKILEDKLRDDLAPQDMELLAETTALPGDSYLYVYDKANQKLKRISSSNLGKIVMEDVDQKFEDQHILNYCIVNKLPQKSDAKVNTVYIVPTKDPEENDRYDEYLYIKETNEFDRLGSVSVDLSRYRTAEDQDLIDQAIQDSVDSLVTKLFNHITDVENPHHVTKEQLGIDDSPELSFLTHYEFPNVGEEKMLYIATDENQMYYWNGDHYVVIKAQAEMPDINLIDGGKSNGWAK